MTTRATACGKAILVGEHAVVYGQPAIAVPVSDVRAEVTVERMTPDHGIEVIAHDLGVSFGLTDSCLPYGVGPLALTLRNVLQHLAVVPSCLSCRIHIRSQVPVARGMGSGPAVATALVRAVASYLGQELAPQIVSGLVYKTEVLLHGTPSGIDNTVVAYERPVYYVQGQEPETFKIDAPQTLVIADTGVLSETKMSVAKVRERHAQEPERFQSLFVEVGGIAEQARWALLRGDARQLGLLMNRNQTLLQDLGVSCQELERLITAALQAGAWGAKLSGGGMGGCMIALCSTETRESIERALTEAGAAAVYSTMVT